MIQLDYNDIINSDSLLFLSIRGSQIHGLATEKSDTDTVSLFCQPIDWGLGMVDVPDKLVKVPGKEDDVMYEIGKFIKGLGKSNPNYLETLFTDERWFLKFDPILKPLWDVRDQLITKACFKSFNSYSKEQQAKAKGLKKAINIDPKKVEVRLTPLHYCIVPKKDKDGSINLLRWLSDHNLKPEHCGATKLSGGIEYYSIYYDWAADKDMTLSTLSELKYGHKGILKFLHLLEWLIGKKSTFIKYRGLLDPKNESTQIRCSEITKADSRYPIISFQFNINAFEEHCKEYKRYWDWVKNRNQERYILNKGYEYDSKSMCHGIRLLKIAIEIAEGRGVNIDRTNIDREFLLEVKNHRYTYEQLMEIIKSLDEKMKDAMALSTLPEEPNQEMLNDILIQIRKEFYARSLNK